MSVPARTGPDLSPANAPASPADPSVAEMVERLRLFHKFTLCDEDAAMLVRLHADVEHERNWKRQYQAECEVRADKIEALEAELEQAREALRIIEAETRHGGQWGFLEINEVARNALLPAETKERT